MELAKSYCEINVILDILGEEYKKRLPKKMIKMFDIVADKEFIPEIKRDDFLNGNYSDETKVILTALYINYWTTAEDKENYMNLLREKDKEYIIPKNIVVIHDVFEKPEIKKDDNINTKEFKEQGLVPVNNSGIFNMIKNLFSNLFQKSKK